MFENIDNTPVLASSAQKEFIRELINSRVLDKGVTVKAALATFDSMEATLTMPHASKIIKNMKARDLRPGSKAAKVVASVQTVPAGVYTVKSGTFTVSRPKGWTPEEGGWFFVKDADGKPRRKDGFDIMKEIAASL